MKYKQLRQEEIRAVLLGVARSLLGKVKKAFPDSSKQSKMKLEPARSYARLRIKFLKPRFKKKKH